MNKDFIVNYFGQLKDAFDTISLNNLMKVIELMKTAYAEDAC